MSLYGTIVQSIQVWKWSNHAREGNKYENIVNPTYYKNIFEFLILVKYNASLELKY